MLSNALSLAADILLLENSLYAFKEYQLHLFYSDNVLECKLVKEFCLKS